MKAALITSGMGLLAAAAGAARQKRPQSAIPARGDRALQDTTPAPTPYAVPAAGPFTCGSVVTMVVGDSQSGNTVAQSVYLEERNGISGALLRRFSVSSDDGNGRPACTLGINYDGAAWNYDLDGFPSISADGRLGAFLCYDYPVGQAMRAQGDNPTTALAQKKVVAALWANGSITYSMPFDAYMNILFFEGIRQVATVDGASGFWLSGMAETAW